MKITHHLLGAICLVAIIILLSRGPAFDDRVSDLFFQNGQWLWPKRDPVLTFWLHDFWKYVFIGIGVASLGVGLMSLRIPRWRPYRRGALCLLLSLTLTPMIVSQIKTETDIFCPSKLARYNGKIPDNYRELTLSPQEIRQADCFPAAHASPGFALLILGVVATTRRRKIMGYGIGIMAGSALSLIQMGRGEHFLSHCIASALVALLVAHALVVLFKVSKSLIKSLMEATQCPRFPIAAKSIES